MVSAEFIGAEKVLSLMDSMKEGTSTAILAVMRRQAITLQNLVKNSYLNGDPLHVRTGTLKRSITQRVTEANGHYEGIVGTNIKYGRYWELGFDRKVGAHARGGPKTITSATAMAKYEALHPSSKKHYAARPFLAPALGLMRPEIIAALQAAVAKAVGK